MDGDLVRPNRIWRSRRLEFEGAGVNKLEGHFPIVIGSTTSDNRFWDWSPRPIRDRVDDRFTKNRGARSREFQIMLRHVLRGVREEDLVALFYFLLASAHFSGQKVEAKGKEILARRRLVADGPDNEVIVLLIKRSVKAEFGEFIAVVQCRDARRPRTGVVVIVGSVAMMRPSRGRRDPVATSGDVAFENRLCLALDAQIDNGLFVLAHSGEFRLRAREDVAVNGF